jgi:putative nucleotidyltransferase with HDIG domain
VQSGFDVGAFWRHSLSTAVIAKLLAKEMKVDETIIEEYFIAGLLHDLGKIVLEEYFTTELRTILHLVQSSGCTFREAEEKLLGINHCEIGKWLATKWLLTPSIVESIQFHHTPLLAEKHRDVVITVYLADLLARVLESGASGEDHMEPINPEIFEELGMSSKLILNLEPKIHEEVIKASSFLEISRE